MEKLKKWDLDCKLNYCDEIDYIYPSDRNMMKLYEKQCEVIDKLNEIETRLDNLGKRE